MGTQSQGGLKVGPSLREGMEVDPVSGGAEGGDPVSGRG